MKQALTKETQLKKSLLDPQDNRSKDNQKTDQSKKDKNSDPKKLGSVVKGKDEKLDGKQQKPKKLSAVEILELKKQEFRDEEEFSVEEQKAVLKAISDIKGLKPTQKSQSYNCCFKTRNTNRDMRVGQHLIQRIFGSKDLVGNFDMANAIKYNQFCRIDKEIQKKNKVVVSLWNQHLFNAIISLFGPFFFWVTLSHSDAVCIAARYFAGIKLAQFVIKVIFLMVLSKFNDESRILILRKNLSCNIVLQTIDLVLELSSLCMIIYLKISFATAMEEDIQSGDEELILHDQQTVVRWTAATISSFLSLLYNQKLLRNLCNDLDYSSVSYTKDQEVYDQIIGNRAQMYDSFKYATALVDKQVVDRRLKGYEMDQIFQHLGPAYLKQAQNKVGSLQSDDAMKKLAILQKQQKEKQKKKELAKEYQANPFAGKTKKKWF